MEFRCCDLDCLIDNSYIKKINRKKDLIEMQRQSVTNLPVPNSYITRLVKSGIEYVNDLKSLKPTDLIKGVFNLYL